MEKTLLDENDNMVSEKSNKHEKNNKIATVPIKKLIWSLGLPMIISMILQAVYNIVDTAFVINMGEDGVVGNLALTYAFPIQLLMIAIGVGTGIGINALLSRSLGEKNSEKVNKTAGNGIFLAFCIYFVFLLFGLFGAKWFISMQANGNAKAIEMGTSYLKICCLLSFGSIGYTIFERFLQATGKTMLSTISQITGALLNIILDYVFIYICGWGIQGAAWATVIGQIASLVMAMIFHFCLNKEVRIKLKDIMPSWNTIKEVYKVGLSAAIMQGLLSVMMLCMNLILGTSATEAELLQGSFGIYYKIMQFALFAFFGISNTIITILSFNYGMGDKARVKECIKWGITDTLIVSAIIIVLFQILAVPLAKLFGMASGSSGGNIEETVVQAIRIASISYLFMAFSVAVQGVLQAFRYALSPLIISLLRLVVFILPITYIFTLFDGASSNVWWAFVISEVLTAIFSILILVWAYKKKVATMKEEKINNTNTIITISRKHGSNGKYIGKLVAQKLGIKYYDKEILSEVAKSTGLAKEYLNEQSSSAQSFASIYLSTKPSQNAIIEQAKVIRKIADGEDCVIIGRGADFILKDYNNVIKIFIDANEKYKIDTVKKLYGDDENEARLNIQKSDNARSVYYNFISGKNWSDANNYDLVVDSSDGPEEAANAIVEFCKTKKPS